MQLLNFVGPPGLWLVDIRTIAYHNYIGFFAGEIVRLDLLAANLMDF